MKSRRAAHSHARPEEYVIILGVDALYRVNHRSGCCHSAERFPCHAEV